jgi:heme oxygenase
MRAYAMKLHTRDQAPREGQQPAEKPFTAWQPGRSNYMNFLVDSLLVYETMDKIVAKYPELEPFRNTGLERSEALREDLKWMVSFVKTLSVPEVGESGRKYAAHLEALAAESLPKFMCHYYNHYFAHTAGGRMIGKKMADTLLGGTTLKFYSWEGDVRATLDETRKKLDAMANTWSAEQKLACLEETPDTFKYGTALMVYMKAPPAV